MKSLIHTIFGFPVDTEDGNMYHTFNDIQIPGRGYPLAFTRTYNSMVANTNGPLGYGWVDNLGAKLAVAGSTTTLTEENGAQTVFTFDGSNWTAPPRDIATLKHNGDGTWSLKRHAQQTLTFNSSGQLTSMADLNGNTTSYSYTAGQLTTVTDSAGRTLRLGYTGGHITKVTDPNVTPPRSVTFSYDLAGDLTKVTDVNGGKTKFTYDGAHRMLTMKDPKCSATPTCPGITNHYDTSGRVDWQTDQLNRKTSFVYAGDPSSATGGTTEIIRPTSNDPNGNVTLDTYEYGVKVSETKGYGTAQAATTIYRYDPATAQPTSISDPNGHTTLMTYDGQGNMLTKQDPLGRTTTYSNYNGLNEAQTIQDPKGVITTNTYDADGNLTSVSTPCPDCTPAATQTTKYAICEPPPPTTTCTVGGATYHQGDIESMTDADAKAWTYAYDTYGNRVSTTDPLGDKSTSTYNADDWLLTTVSPNGNVSGGNPGAFTTKYSHDNFGDVMRKTDPLGHITVKSYDADRNLVSVKDPNGNKTTYAYDLANEQTTVKRPDGTSTSTTYWPDGTVKQQIDGKHNPIQSYTYDSLGRVITVTDAIGDTTTYTYDAAGNKLTKQDPGGSCSALPAIGCTTMAYDAANQLTSVTYSDGTTPNVTNIIYDLDGQRTGMTDGTGTSTRTYDSLHRLTSYTNGALVTVGYGYNLRNLPTTITYPGGHTVTQGYDDAGRLTSVQDWLISPNTTTFGYDANGNVTSDTLPNGVIDTYKFNAADQLMAISDMRGTTTIFSATYTRDKNGQLTSDSRQPANQGAYKYTGLNQLCYAGSRMTKPCSKPPANSFPYAYDGADNLTTMENSAHTGTNTQAFNAADQLTSAGASTTTACNLSPPSGTTSFCSDTRGNRTSAVPNSGPSTCNTYDQADRLTSIQTGTGPSCTSPTNVGTYAYDGTGLRMSKTVGGTTTQFTWDEAGSLPLLLQEKAATANATSYISGPDGLPVEQIDSSGNPHFYAHDQLGSTRALTDTTGTVQATYTYDPYGNVVSSSGTVANPFQFAGQFEDTESGLYYLRARYYDATTAQFLTSDPEVAATSAPYGYAAGNPVNATDSSGMAIDPSQPNCDSPQNCQIGMQLFRLDVLRRGLSQQVQDETRQFDQNAAGFEQAMGGRECVTPEEGQMLMSSAGQLERDTNQLNQIVQTENAFGSFAVQAGYGSTTNHNPLAPIAGGIAGAGVCSAGLKGAVATAQVKGTIIWACFIGGAIASQGT